MNVEYAEIQFTVKGEDGCQVSRSAVVLLCCLFVCNKPKAIKILVHSSTPSSKHPVYVCRLMNRGPVSGYLKYNNHSFRINNLSLVHLQVSLLPTSVWSLNPHISAEDFLYSQLNCFHLTKEAQSTTVAS